MSVSSVQTILFDVAPELYTVDATALERIARFINRAFNNVNEDLAGDQYDEMVALLTAHRLTMSIVATSGGLAASGGALLSERVDNAAYTYANGTGVKSPNWETKYGRQFDAMMADMLPYGPMVLSD